MNRSGDKNDKFSLVSDCRKAKGSYKDNEYFFDEFEFKEMLILERKRSQRSMKPLILMCLDISGMKTNFAHGHWKLLESISTGIRETDVRGWIKRGSVAGILFTDLQSAAPSVREILFRRVMAHLVSQMDPVLSSKIKASFRIYPEDKVHDDIVDRFDMRYHRHPAKIDIKKVSSGFWIWGTALAIAVSVSAFFGLDAYHTYKTRREASAWLERGNVLFNAGQYEPAIEAYNKTLSLGTGNGEAYINRGRAYERVGRKQEAIKDFAQAIHLNSKYAAAIDNRFPYIKKIAKRPYES